jgi:hypothetical protein
MEKTKPTDNEQMIMDLLKQRSFHHEWIPDDFISKWCILCFKSLDNSDTGTIALEDKRLARTCKKCDKQEDEEDISHQEIEEAGEVC